jgi:hypothetical protein
VSRARKRPSREKPSNRHSPTHAPSSSRTIVPDNSRPPSLPNGRASPIRMIVREYLSLPHTTWHHMLSSRIWGHLRAARSRPDCMLSRARVRGSDLIARGTLMHAYERRRAWRPSADSNILEQCVHRWTRIDSQRSAMAASGSSLCIRCRRRTRVDCTGWCRICWRGGLPPVPIRPESFHGPILRLQHVAPIDAIPDPGHSTTDGDQTTQHLTDREHTRTGVEDTLRVQLKGKEARTAQRDSVQTIRKPNARARPVYRGLEFLHPRAVQSPSILRSRPRMCSCSTDSFLLLLLLDLSLQFANARLLNRARRAG